MRLVIYVLSFLLACSAGLAQDEPQRPNTAAIKTIEAYFKAREADDAAAMLSLVDRAAHWKAKTALKTFEGGHDDIVEDLKVVGFEAPPRIGFTVMNNAGEIVTLQVDYTGPVNGSQFTVTRMETFIVVAGRIEMVDAEYTGMRAAR